MASKKDEIRRQMAEMLIARLEEGVIPWRSYVKDFQIPQDQKNGVSKKTYKGCNWFFLQLVANKNGYYDPRWFTFKQAKEKNYKVKKGEKGTPVEFFRIYDRQTKNDVDELWYNSLSQDEQTELWDSGRLSMILKHSYVFNAHQLDGIELVPKPTGIEEDRRIEPAEAVRQLSKNMNVPILYDQTKRSFYNTGTDEIHVPTSGWFENIEAFNSAQLHELAHSTGHQSRMNRDMTGLFGSSKYAKEELRAEIASMFMARQVAIEYDDMYVSNHAAYVQSWIQMIRKDPNALFAAIKDAEKINDYMIRHLDRELQQALTGEVKDSIQPAQEKPSLKERMDRARRVVAERKAAASAHDEPCKER